MTIKTNFLQSNFTLGEISPKLEGRVDFAKYSNGANAMENFLVLPYGGARRRPGTYFVSEVKTSAKATRLVPFQFSVTQAYILEFGDAYIRVYKDSGRIEQSGTPVEIVTPYLEAELFELNFAQSADVLYIAHKNYAPRKLERTSHTAWALTPIKFEGGPFSEDNLTNITVTAGATTGATTLTLAVPAWATATSYRVGDWVTSGGNEYRCLVSHVSGTFATDLTAVKWVQGTFSYFSSSYVGSFFKMAGTTGADPKIQGYLEITGYTSTKVVNALVRQTLSASAATKDWAIGAWNAVNGYPSVVGFFEQRLFWASSTAQPQTIWGSVSGAFENHSVGVADDDALDYTVYSEEVNAIRWLVGGKVLHVGTQGGAYTMYSGSQTEPLTPTNVLVTAESGYGTSAISAKRIGNYVYYIQRGGRKLREISYEFQSDSYKAADATIYAEHITESGIVDMDYQQTPHNFLWCVRDDGELAVMQREIEQEVVGWSRVVTDGEFESVAIIPNGEEDQVWVVVKRTIGSTTKRFVEYFKPIEFGDQEDAFFVDCGLSYSGAATETVTGATHLNGMEVNILTNGAVHSKKTVVGGAVSLDWEATKVHLGLPFTPRLKLSRPEIGDLKQSTQGMTKKISWVDILLYESGSFKIGDDSTQDQMYFRTSSMNMDEAVELFSGFKEYHVPNDYSKDSRLLITQDQPLPLHISAIVLEITIQPR
jgi:hypothetical protein